jgi:hypothetical protein
MRYPPPALIGLVAPRICVIWMFSAVRWRVRGGDGAACGYIDERRGPAAAAADGRRWWGSAG